MRFGAKAMQLLGASLMGCLVMVVALPTSTSLQQQQYQTGSSATLSAELQRERRQAASAKSNKKTKAFELECLAAHNKWRRLHQANDLVFDKKIAAFAQKRADFIAASDGDEFRHPDDLPYGENLAWHSRATTSCADLIKMWYDEVELYNFRRGQFDHETGHFTQLVWRNTERVGCARAFSSGPKGGIYLVCNYDPPGNFLGEAIENVLVRKNPTQVVSMTTTTSTARSTTALAVTPVPQVVTSTTSVAPPSSSTAKPDKTEVDSNGKRKKKGKKNKKGKKKNKKNKNKKNKNKKNNNKPASTTNSSLNLQPAAAPSASSPSSNSR